MSGLDGLGLSFAGLAAAIPRLAVAFTVLPLLTGEIVPPMVRNVFAFAMALTLYPMILGTLDAGALDALSLAPLILREAALGLAIGWLFGIVFWALEGAGELIDAKIGSTTAQIVDPILGHQTTLTATFLSRLAAYLFVSVGGLSVFLGVLLRSYAVWPVDAALPTLNPGAQTLFVARFSDLLSMTLLLAAPVLVVLSLVEFGFGLVNRFAERLNVFAVSMAVKAWLAVAVLALSLTTMIEYLVARIAGYADLLDELAPALGAGG